VNDADLQKMNWSLECNLRPKLTTFLVHVQTDVGNDPETWVQNALELSTPVYIFLGNAMLTGFVLSGDIQWALDKVLDTLVMWKAKEEEQHGEKYQLVDVGIDCCQSLSRPSFQDSSGTLIQKLPGYNWKSLV
jgi:hypothetical protein